jgi:hypothetical protein
MERFFCVKRFVQVGFLGMFMLGAARPKENDVGLS